MYKLYSLLIVLLLWTSCTGDSTDEQLSLPSGNRMIFSFSTIQGDVEESGPVARGKEIKETIAQLKYTVFNENGQVIHPRWQKLSPDFTSLIMEGLEDGNYSVVFFATTNEDKTSFQPTNEGDKFYVSSPSADKPLNEDYLFARMDFSRGKESGSRTIDVPLKRCVGRVEIDVTVVHPYTAYLINKVEVSFDKDSKVYLSKTADSESSYEGTGTVSQLDVTADRAFYSLPSQAPLSGTITIESVREDDKPAKSVYRFSNLNIEAGKTTHIKVDWESAVGNKGLFNVHESDYTDANSSIMLQDDEPREVFYNQSLRSFRTDKPLQVKINSDKELQLNFYSPVTIHNVTILFRFKKYSYEFFKFAHYEKITGFSESRMYIPLVGKTLTYTSKDGRNIVIPAQPNLTNEDCEFIIESDDPYMAKIATITHPISINFSPYGADSGHAYWRHMNPNLCRHGCVMAVNMSFMFNSQDFVDKINNWTGNPFVDDSKNPIAPQTVINRARNISRLVMGTVSGVGGLGGNYTYGLAPYCYTMQYWDTEGKYSYGKQATFHEFGHCMGYGHSSSMTYGDAWTKACQELIYDLGSTGRLPVSNANWASNYQ